MLQQGDFAVDGTCGNGLDTLFLAQVGAGREIRLCLGSRASSPQSAAMLMFQNSFEPVHESPSLTLSTPTFSIPQLPHYLLRSSFTPPRQAVGATGSVLAIDVQQRAVDATKELLERSLEGPAMPEVQYECVCHSQLLKVRPAHLKTLLPSCFSGRCLAPFAEPHKIS